MGEAKSLWPAERRIAYFSMEIAIDPAIPTYSGGLGVLAGDTLRAAADLGVPIVGVTLLSEQGYFTQTIDNDGNQSAGPTNWDIRGLLGDPHTERVMVEIEGRTVQVRAWQRDIVGATGFSVPVLLLDTNLEENTTGDRALTQRLYGGDQRYRLCQEVVLGIGGIRMLSALGYRDIAKHHMNEGHAALLALELFRDETLRSSCSLDKMEECIARVGTDVRTKCVFTTHTPVAAGHDRFPYALVRQVLGDYMPQDLLRTLGGENELNMTLLALHLSHYVNSVARQHQHVSEHLFPGYHFSNITNGVHSATWTCPEIAKLFDSYIPHWRQDSFDLRYALRIPEHEIWDAHQKMKRRLVDYVNEKKNAGFDTDTFTIGFARRATAYKRMDLLFHDIKRLRALGQGRKLQIIFAGKAHPNDTEGQNLIRKIHWHMGEVRDVIRIVYLSDYDVNLAKLLVPGVDLWLNTPARPKEASGTSGMKAAHNGVPQMSIQDGWWMEGHIEGVTGWEIGPVPTEQNESMNDDNADSEELYDKLEHIVLPLYYDDRAGWMKLMRNCIAFNASFFNTHRMVQQYALHAYLI